VQVYVSGVRNPYRLHTFNGAIYQTDTGWYAWEEVRCLHVATPEAAYRPWLSVQDAAAHCCILTAVVANNRWGLSHRLAACAKLAAPQTCFLPLPCNPLQVNKHVGPDNSGWPCFEGPEPAPLYAGMNKAPW
jgi:hypothetical protein